MSKIDTEENRFHALKFAAQTLGNAHPGEVVQAANLYLDFLEGRLATTAEQAQAETWVPATTAPVADEPVELADLTESYPAEDPVAVVDSWAAADRAISDIALVSELFEEGPHEAAYANPHADELLAKINAGPADEPVTAEEMRPYIDALETEPTFEYVAAAVEQIASPPPPAPDATDEPELTDEQVERIEERLAIPDPITAAEHDPEREFETAGVYVNKTNPFKSWLR
jgi:hypothetical protein